MILRLSLTHWIRSFLLHRKPAFFKILITTTIQASITLHKNYLF